MNLNLNLNLNLNVSRSATQTPPLGARFLRRLFSDHVFLAEGMPPVAFPATIIAIDPFRLHKDQIDWQWQLRVLLLGH